MVKEDRIMVKPNSVLGAFLEARIKIWVLGYSGMKKILSLLVFWIMRQKCFGRPKIEYCTNRLRVFNVKTTVDTSIDTKLVTLSGPKKGRKNAASSILLLSLKLNVIGWIEEVGIKIHKTMTKVSSMNSNVNLLNPSYNSQFFSPVLKCGCL